MFPCVCAFLFFLNKKPFILLKSIHWFEIQNNYLLVFLSGRFPRLRATSTTPSCFSTPPASRTLPPVDVWPEQPSRRCVTITSRQVLFCFVLFCFVLFCFVYVISQDLRLIFTLWYNYTKTSSVTIVWLFHLTQIESFKMFLDYFWRMLYWYFVMDSLTFSPFPKI
jgi:hypothetical protein